MFRSSKSFVGSLVLVALAGLALAAPRPEPILGAAGELAGTTPTPRDLCWTEFKNLLKDCRTNFPEQDQRQACYVGAGIVLRQCLDALRPAGTGAAAAIEVLPQNQSLPALPSWTYGQGTYPVTISGDWNWGGAHAYMVDCDEWRPLSLTQVGPDLNIETADPDCDDASVTLVITLENKGGLVIAAQAVSIPRSIPCDANSDGMIDANDVDLVLAQYSRGLYSPGVLVDFLVATDGCQ